jgi:TatD DNase family protein
MPLFDTHCHLDDPRLAAEREAVLGRAAQAGVERIATIGCVRSIENLRSAIEVAEAYPGKVVSTIGVHPHDASSFSDELEAAITGLAEHASVVAIGEAGLDYYYDHSPRETQREVFRRQIALARELDLPLVVHTRDAAADTLAVLREENARDVGGIIHCFSEDAEFARAALDMGFVSSFSGIVTFKNARAVQEAARVQPLSDLLVETDAPYLAPIPHRGRTNEPAFVAHTAAAIAAIRGIPVEMVISASWENAHRVFRLPLPQNA